MKQLEFKVDSTCDQCSETKTRSFSQFGQRKWTCGDCYKLNVKRQQKHLEESMARWAKNYFKLTTTKTHTADGIACQVTKDGVIRRDYVKDCEDVSEQLLFYLKED
jgi:hypothetical protein